MYYNNILSKGFARMIWKNRIIPVYHFLNGEKEKGEEYISRQLQINPKLAYCDDIDKVFLKNYHAL